MNKIVRLNEENKNSWENFVKENKNSMFYHSLNFKDLIEKTYMSCKEEYFLLVDGEVKAIFPFFLVKSNLVGDRLICLPFTDHGSFLGDYNKEDIGKLIEELKKINSNIEIRSNSFLNNFEDNKKIFLNLGFKEDKSKNQVFLELKEDLWDKFDRITRKGIKKAEKSNLKIEVIEGDEELKAFYKLYLKNMKNFGAPQHSYDYFENLFMDLKENSRGLNCYYENKLIASLIVLYSKNYVHAMYNPSDGKYLKYQPNDLLHWEIIKWANNENLKYFDIGQCDSDAEKGTRAEGINRFKKKWLGKIYDRSYFYLNKEENNSNKNKLKKFGVIWKKLPLPLIKIIGPKITSQLAI